MGYPTEISWTDATVNPVGGCSIKSAGCQNCYSQRIIGTRLATHPLYAGTTDIVKGKSVFNGYLTVAADDHDVWKWPLRWRGAKNPVMGKDMPSAIFVADMSDLFHEDRPRRDIRKVLDLCEETKHVTQLLTKRPEVMVKNVGTCYRVEREKIWLGFSAERQREFDERWEHMRPLTTLGWIVFVSIEPMLGPITLPVDFLECGRRAWVICGGESGPDRRETNADWFRAIRDQCLIADVSYFTKQMTGKKAIPKDLMIREFPKVPSWMFSPQVMSRISNDPQLTLV
jgi:protein gp37